MKAERLRSFTSSSSSEKESSLARLGGWDPSLTLLERGTGGVLGWEAFRDKLAVLITSESSRLFPSFLAPPAALFS